MTLKEITQRITEIQHLAESDSAAALKQNQSLFVDFSREDEAYIVPDTIISEEALNQKNFRPYIAPAQVNDPRLFLRVFSHKDVANAFANKNNHQLVCKIDGVELMQLAKFYFLRGVYGFILNDGLAWAAISFPLFLTGCFRDILGDPALGRPEYISLIEFINMVRQNDYYQIVVARQIVKAADDVEKIFFLSPGKKARFEGAEYIFEELSVPKLLQFSSAHENAHIHIRTDKITIQVSSAMLVASFRASGIDRPPTDKFYTDLDFHTDSIALDFRIGDFPSPDMPISQHVQLAELPKPHEDIPDDGKAEATSNRKPLICAVISFFRGLFDRESSIGDKPQEKENTCNKSVSQSRHNTKIRPVLLRKILFFSSAAIVVCIICVIGFSVFKPSSEDILYRDIENEKYTNIADQYASCVESDPSSESELLEYMIEDLNLHLKAYAANEETAETLRAAIDGYSEITAMQEDVNSVYQKASALESSKIAYETGLRETSVLDRLSVWQKVIKDDTGSQNLIATNLQQNAEQYKYTVFLEVKEQNPYTALANLMLLQNYYPNDKDISDKVLEVSKQAYGNLDENVSGKSPEDHESDEPIFDPEEHSEFIAPITIHDISVKDFGWEGRKDLYINWENQSGKEIAQIIFNVFPYNSSGEQEFTSVPDENGEYYSLYLATDIGPFAVDYKTPSKHYWEAAWYNNAITSAGISSVTIYYAGSSSPDIISDTDELQALFQFSE